MNMVNMNENHLPLYDLMVSRSPLWKLNSAGYWLTVSQHQHDVPGQLTKSQQYPLSKSDLTNT